MFDFHAWVNWTSRRVAALRHEGLQASFTFAEESKRLENPAFFIDVDAESGVSRMVVWSTGDFDVCVLRDDSETALPINNLPGNVTDQSFQSVFDRFVDLARG